MVTATAAGPCQAARRSWWMCCSIAAIPARKSSTGVLSARLSRSSVEGKPSDHQDRRASAVSGRRTHPEPFALDRGGGVTRATFLPMRWPQEPTGDVGLPVTLLNADSWVASLLLIRTAIASSFVNKSDGHTLEIASRRSKHCKPVINSATWVDPSHLRVQLSHAVVASLVADILQVPHPRRWPLALPPRLSPQRVGVGSDTHFRVRELTRVPDARP